MTRWRRTAAALAVFATTAAAPAPTIDTADVARFYRLYDAAGGAPSAETLQRNYLDAGSDGVRQFIPNRIVSAEALAERIRAEPGVYDGARACMAALPGVKRRLAAAFRRLARLDPQARFPPVTILIGRNSSGGTSAPSGVLIGLEVVCRSDWLQTDPGDRLTHLIAHEYGHVQQDQALEDDPAKATVLQRALIEGVAELVGELISGEVSNAHLARWVKGRENALAARFLADAGSKDLSAWLYNGAGTPDAPGDLGYWAGHGIARAYYARAKNKRAALRTLLDLKDPQAILHESGWGPGNTG